MRTLLSQFSEEFDRVVRPILSPLDEAVDRLASSSRGGGHVLRSMRDLQHEMSVLVDKVAGQQAFVLIFGPLKSGKSTLMNGVAAAYVSEVSSLPAYPCMVYVSHADRLEYVIQRYNGETERFSSPASLRVHITRAHTELAERIRESEASDVTFDPALHFPEAIRRIDVRVPAGKLEQSGAVLVDTPGLYSRMKFGYDRMTREFRNTAACAIFVVKSDNLFLEQVFEEFTDLLELFSRIFLVVNIDSTKRDLGPDGRLTPSLEQEDPLRIIEAFENLSMSAPLKAAADAGRLDIYAIDLLNSASDRLREAKGKGDPGLPIEDVGSVGSRGATGFDTFLGDLSNYLNSTDYLIAFIVDSLRRSRGLLGELTQGCRDEEVRELVQSVASIERDRDQVVHRREAIDRLAEFEWEEEIQGLRGRIEAATKERGRTLADKTTRGSDTRLDAWFESEASLQSLNEDDLLPLLANHRRDLAAFVNDVLNEESAGRTAGLNLSANLEQALVAAGIRLSELAREAAADLETALPPMNEFDAPVAVDDVPVKKGFWDWFMFRRQGTVRRRLFGSPSPSRRIPSPVKSARLGEKSMGAMKGAIDLSLGKFFRATSQEVRGKMLEVFAVRFGEGLEELLETRRRECASRQRLLEDQLSELRAVVESVQRLESACESALEDLDGLASQFEKPESHLLETGEGDEAEETVELVPALPEIGEVLGAEAAESGTEASEESESDSDAIESEVEPERT